MRILAVALISSCAAWSAAKPVVFEPNRGQAAAGADFVAHGDGFALTLRAGRADLISGKTRLTTVLAGARTSAPVEGESPLPGVVNYLNGNDRSHWITGIPTYSRVRYRAVYPGVDLVYYGNSGKLEYDFVVSPGADPHAISLRYDGARSLRTNASGDLIVETADGDLRQQRPVAYQDIEGVRHQIAGDYRIHGKTVTFALAAYDRKRALVIDPVLTWSTFVAASGAIGFTVGENAAVDSSGNVYLIGTTVDSLGYYAILISELNSSGANVNTTFYDNPPYLLEGHAVAVDSAGNIYFGGEITDGQTFQYGFVGKLSPGGAAVIFSGEPNQSGIGQDSVYGVAVDSSSNFYVVGATTSTAFPVTTGAAQVRNAGGYDGFVAKYSSAGSELAATYLGGSGNDGVYAIAVDSSGDAFVTGATASTNFPATSGAFQTKAGGSGGNAFIAKLSPTLGMVFCTYLGGSGSDVGNAIAVDAGGAVYVTGETTSTNFPTLGAIQGNFGGGQGDLFLTKLNGNGQSLGYSTYFGGSGEDLGNGITVDASNNAYVTGATSSTDFPTTPNAFQTAYQGTVSNAIVLAVDSTGAKLFSSYLGGNGSQGTTGDSGNAIAANCASGLVVAGTTSSSNFPTTNGVYLGAYPGGTSAGFLTKVAAGPANPVISSGGVIGTWSPAAGPVAPGSLLSIYGSGFAVADSVSGSLPLPTNVLGTTVKINGNAVPILYASATQMNVQVPYEVSTGTAVVTVNNACGASQPVIVQVSQAAPYIYSLPGSSDALAYNQDYTVNSPTNPAPVGSEIFVFVTGIGPVSNSPGTGAGASGSPLSSATLPHSATIGNFDTQIPFLGLTPGTVIAQANLVIPNLSPGQYPVVLTVNGMQSNGPYVYTK